MNAFVAFLHHICFVIIMIILSIQMLLLKQPMTALNAKKILRYDMIYGLAALLILLIGSLRVMWFEKGPAYYMHSTPFMVKMGLFIVIGLLSIYPTVTFLKWRKPLEQGVVPVLGDTANRKLRLFLHLELTLLALMILFAAMMAKGIGYSGH